MAEIGTIQRRNNMGEKDITEKLLEDYNDVFADIINVLLFDGKRLMAENELSNTKDKSQYKMESKVHEQERDVAKFWNEGTVHIALCGLENQTNIDYDMPLRVIGYDGATYKAQLVKPIKVKEKKKDSVLRYPVVTLVLYFNYKKRWNGKTTLYECLQIPEELKPYVSDYKINVFEIAFLEEEQVAMFQSDFRIVADYFVQMRKNKDYRPSQDTIHHVDEVLKLMSVLTQDRRFEDAQNESKGEVKNMCEALDKLIEKGREEGRVIAYADVGFSIDEIARKVGMTKEEVNNILQEQN